MRVPGWERIPGLVAGFCGCRGGVSRGAFAALNLSARVGDDPAAVRDNWSRLAATVGHGMHFVRMQQVHGDAIATVEGPAAEVGAADAMLTRASAVALCVLTADCVPLLMVAPRHHVVAAVHAGWRGTLAGIAARAVRHMQQVYGVEPADVRVALGPAIGGCCYEVDAGVAQALEQRWGPMPAAIRSAAAAGVAPGKAMVDLRQVNRAHLVAAGVRGDLVVDAGPCTRCTAGEYFSHREATRRAVPAGRQVSFIGWCQ